MWSRHPPEEILLLWRLCCSMVDKLLPKARKGQPMSSAFVLAIDQGTTSTRAILFDAAGRARSAAQRELAQHYPRPGWVEHDPEEIWHSVVATCRKAMSAADGPVAAIGVTNQRETTLLWERATGR